MAKREKCDTCQRGKRYFDGCSHPTCPKRRQQTARVVGDLAYANPIGVLHGQTGNSTIRRMPTNTEE